MGQSALSNCLHFSAKIPSTSPMRIAIGAVTRTSDSVVIASSHFPNTAQ